MTDQQPSPPRTYPALALCLAVVAVAAALAESVVVHRARGFALADPRLALALQWFGALRLVAAPSAIAALLLALPARRVASARGRSSVALVLAFLAAGIVVEASSTASLLTPPQPRKTQCLSNVKNIALALNMYASDYGSFPAAGAWSDVLDEYLRNPDIYRCPREPRLRFAFAYNHRLGGARLNALVNADRLVSVFESDRGRNAFGGPELLPEYPRHSKGDNYGFADGHVRWYARKSKPVSGQSEPQWLKAPVDTAARITWEPEAKVGGR